MWRWGDVEMWGRDVSMVLASIFSTSPFLHISTCLSNSQRHDDIQRAGIRGVAHERGRGTVVEEELRVVAFDLRHHLEQVARIEADLDRGGGEGDVHFFRRGAMLGAGSG